MAPSPQPCLLVSLTLDAPRGKESIRDFTGTSGGSQGPNKNQSPWAGAGGRRGGWFLRHNLLRNKNEIGRVGEKSPATESSMAKVAGV